MLGRGGCGADRSCESNPSMRPSMRRSRPPRGPVPAGYTIRWGGAQTPLIGLANRRGCRLFQRARSRLPEGFPRWQRAGVEGGNCPGRPVSSRLLDGLDRASSIAREAPFDRTSTTHTSNGNACASAAWAILQTLLVRPFGMRVQMLRSFGRVTNCHMAAQRPASGRCSISHCSMPDSMRRMQIVRRFKSGVGFALHGSGIESCTPALNASQ